MEGSMPVCISSFFWAALARCYSSSWSLQGFSCQRTDLAAVSPVTVGSSLGLLLTVFSSCRDDSNPMCMSGHIPGWPLGEEAQPVCSGSHQDGHAGEPGVHSLLRVLPVPGL